jgi:hypothetical protein
VGGKKVEFKNDVAVFQVFKTFYSTIADAFAVQLYQIRI